jgi:DNA-binding NarL/FixJ family response regulator
MTMLLVKPPGGGKILISTGASEVEVISNNKQKEAKMPTKILVASKNRLVRKAIADILHANKQYGLYVVAEASTKEEVFEMVQLHQLDCIILDTDFGPKGDFTYLVYTSNTQPKVKLLYLGGDYKSVEEYQDYAYQVLYRRGKGIIEKDSTDGELIYALLTIVDGGRYFFRGWSENDMIDFEKANPYGVAFDDTPLFEREKPE